MLTRHHFQQLLSGSLRDTEARRLLSSLQPETINEAELFAIVAQLQESAVADFERLRPYGTTAIDCCGTGGSGLPRFNTSTAVAFVVAAAGVKVAKFGNRATNSRSGSFDVLDCLGVPARVDGDLAERLLCDCNVVFLFAPQVYPALARLAPIRRSIPHKTVLNFVGPLLNPVQPTRRLVGVSDRHMQRLLASFLASRSELSCVVQAGCGLDEICPGCHTEITTVGCAPAPPNLAPMLGSYRLRMPCASRANLHETFAPTAEQNAQAMLKLFYGATGRDLDVDRNAYELVCVNAAAALLIAGRCPTLADANRLVRELLAAGKVKEHYKKVIDYYAKHTA